MALQVWLPLTKDLRNQGLSNVTVTNNGATFNSAGKLGGCYSFGTGDSYITIDSTPLKTFTEFSFACWVKIISWNTSYSTVFAAKNGTSVGWTNLIFALLRNSSNSTLCFNIADGSSHTTTTNCQTGTLSLNTWYHIVCTYKSGEIKLYQDGDVVSTFKTTVVPNFNSIVNLWIGKSNANSYQSNNLLNDVRIYDHCLSPMEVKELSKGLVLHYPLNRGGWGQNNILLNTGFESRYTQSTGWDTTKNGTQLASSWGGYNGGVTNPSTVYHAHLKQVNGEWVYEYIRTANESWLGISQGGLQSKLTAGKTYTFSWEEYRVEGNNYPTGGLYYYKTGATTAYFHLGQFGGSSGNVLGKWRRFTYTFVAPSDGDYSKNMSWYIYGTSGGNGKMYMRHPKLEEGSIATPWCPNFSDALATTMGLNGTTEYDCSGFCNNGTRTGTFSWTSNTPKYAVSQVFNGTDNAIQTPSLPTMITDKNYTIAVWIYKTVIGSKGYQTIYGGPSGFEIEARNGGANETKFVPWNWGKPMASYELNEWNHCVFVHSDADCKIYLNGEYIATGTAKTSNPTGNYFVGAWNTATQQNFDGQMSDFRIYATALSASDVKSLYQNCATIDSDGTICGKIR